MLLDFQAVSFFLRLRTIFHFHFHKQARHVRLHRAQRQEKPLGNFCVAKALR